MVSGVVEPAPGMDVDGGGVDDVADAGVEGGEGGEGAEVVMEEAD